VRPERRVASQKPASSQELTSVNPALMNWLLPPTMSAVEVASDIDPQRPKYGPICHAFQI
jgi:hypothetical protein